jgi:hypothetical protein
MLEAFKRREAEFENKFAHDEEVRFRIQSRRDWLFGLWAAEKLGFKGPVAEAYARGLVHLDIETKGDGEVIEKVRHDFLARGIEYSPNELVCEAKKFWEDARRQIFSH